MVSGRPFTSSLVYSFISHNLEITSSPAVPWKIKMKANMFFPELQEKLGMMGFMITY
jgi:hypothetical protein